MIGVGNDNSGPYTHGVPMDLHYAYLDGYGDQGGWPTWVNGVDDGAYGLTHLTTGRVLLEFSLISTKSPRL